MKFSMSGSLKFSTEPPQSPSHTGLFFSFLLQAGKIPFSPFSCLFNTAVATLSSGVLLSTKKEGRGLWSLASFDPLFTYLWQNHTDFFCFKDFTANSSGKNIEEIKITNVGMWWRLQTLNNVLTDLFPWWWLLDSLLKTGIGNFPLNPVL